MYMQGVRKVHTLLVHELHVNYCVYSRLEWRTNMISIIFTIFLYSYIELLNSIAQPNTSHPYQLIIKPLFILRILLIIIIQLDQYTVD